MKAVIVDDERLARNALRRLLAAHPEITIVGEAASADEAVRSIQRLNPDILLLDVEMPGGTGFDVLEQLDSVPAVIFTTAYDHYAVRAFEVSALDYLVKPIVADRLAAALQRATTVLAECHSPRVGPEQPSASRRIFVRDGDKCWIVRLMDISLFESVGNYTRVHFEGHAPLILRSLSGVEHRVGTETFFRANRSQVVNLSWIAAVEHDAEGRLVVTLRQGRRIEVSRRQSRVLTEVLSL